MRMQRRHLLKNAAAALAALGLPALPQWALAAKA
ncbi:twin-arginine translocation signal domain-containing protein, partial [Xanthomonas oryzae]